MERPAVVPGRRGNRGGRGIGRGNKHQRRSASYDHGNTRPSSSCDKQESRQFDRKQSDNSKMLRFKALEELSGLEPEEIVIKLACSNIGFKELLNSKNLTNDTLVLIMRVLVKGCRVPLKVNKMTIINLAVSENFQAALQTFILNTIFASTLEKRNSSYFWTDVDGFFSDVHRTFQAVFETIPTKACEVLDRTVEKCLHTLKHISEQNLVKSETIASFEKLHQKFKMYKEEIEIKKMKSAQDYHYEQPPDNFRELTVYPNEDEIMSSSFVRKNLIDRPYDSVDHYLDVQFRLLKEDFVRPLREGILEYQSSVSSSSKSQKFLNVRIHKEVKFLTPFCSRSKFGVLLQFEDGKKKKTKKNYSYTKRFMYGSLLCFTRDNFKTLLFGKIIERDQKQLERGEILVGFELGQDNYELNVPYTMVECTVYFEPYYHVLKAMQNIFEDDFAMRRYIIDVNPDIVRPKYLNDNSSYEIDDFTVPLFGDNWPTAAQLNLNESQYSAFKAGLTQEYAVIQGPPGTGKTYLGLKLARTFIRNRTHWHDGSPILVVCYTNHALDQFLEGIITVTNDVVRVGGQCKNKNLEKFSLMEKRRVVSCRMVHTGSHTYGRALHSLRRQLEAYMRTIKDITDRLEEIRNKVCVIDFSRFAIIDKDYANSWFYAAKDEEITKWLLERRIDRNQRMIIELNKPKSKIVDDDVEKAVNEFDELLNIEAMEEVDDLDVFVPLVVVSNSRSCLLKVEDMLTEVEQLRTAIDLLQEKDAKSVYDRKIELTERMHKLLYDIDYIEGYFQKFGNTEIHQKPLGCNLKNPSEMSSDDRWILYFYWLRKYEKFLVDSIAENETERREVYNQYVELQALQDVDVMREMVVVGMTTTGAARLQSVLSSLRSPIVIVEEAAEVLEAHIIVSLTSHCRHLILIGDHRQLRPSTASFHMGVKYHLGISLFERMVLNNIQCHTLGVQHRMRPEIATLIVPAVYPKLDNHPSVEEFPNVSGVDTNLYFIDHENQESELFDSKLNYYEVKYLLLLARHLVLNGCKPEDITILAAYTAQLFTFWTEQKKYDHLLKDVNIKVLDNYQGEENKIILLSLVRNNSEGKIGFLKIENRVCVALSRAREGLYIMGNMKQLCAGSEIWPKVKVALNKANALGKSLAFRCKFHTENVTQITTLEDFDKVSEGGCSAMCDYLMKCGHVCLKVCHVIDREHEKIACKADCRRILCENDHLCPKMCFEKCGPCMVPLKKRFTKCSHVVWVACSTNLETVKCMELVAAKLPCGHTDPKKPCHIPEKWHNCPFPCAIRVEPCGHSCTLSCHIQNDPDHINYTCRKPCEKQSKGCSTGKHKCQKDCYEECSLCEIVIEKRRTTCAHRIQIPCHEDPDKIKCTMGCRRLLPCGHACKKKCFEPCGDCRVKVEKQLEICKHMIKVRCNETPTRDLCTEQCPLILPCGHRCQARCNEACTKKCEYLVDHENVADCGHKFKIPCHLRHKALLRNSYKLLQYCKEPCGAKLECGHSCLGTCGSCAQGRIHISCAEKCGRILICGHECPFPCREACQPCNRVCTYKCSHSACRKQCGEPCTKCVEACERRCPHSRCVRRCGDTCSAPPCTFACKKTLRCGHPCVGFCGDPCPPLCRICNEEELTETFFGTEDEEDARFVVLNECGHVLESSGMEQWMNVKEEDNSINYNSCPKCKTPLSSTQRYSDYIKANMRDVYAIKLKFFGNPKDNEKMHTDLAEKLKNLDALIKQITDPPSLLQVVVSDLQNSVKFWHKGRRVTLNMSTARICLSKVQVLENIVRVFISDEFARKLAMKDMKFLLQFLRQKANVMTNQEIIDLEREVDKFSLKIQMYALNKDASVLKKVLAENGNEDLYLSAQRALSSIDIFNDFSAKKVRENIKNLSRKVGTHVTQYERQQVVKAMNMQQGHWFKCPNGHYYAIGECGGAMEVGKCIECGVSIGGQQHALLPTNRHAPEMDGSSYAAYSETANNLFNYEGFGG